jgi:hypothetical protein
VYIKREMFRNMEDLRSNGLSLNKKDLNKRIFVYNYQSKTESIIILENNSKLVKGIKYCISIPTKILLYMDEKCNVKYETYFG